MRASSRVSLRSVAIGAAYIVSFAGCGEPAPSNDVAAQSSGLAVINTGYSFTFLSFSPAGIADSGVIVGTTDVGTPTPGAVSQFNGAVSFLALPPGIGTLARVDAVSKSGVAVGVAVGGLTQVGVVWQVTPTCPLGNCTPPLTFVGPSNAHLFPQAVNNNFEVAGAFIVGTQPERAFRWTPSGGFEDITPVGFTTAQAEGINDNGYIVGEGQRPGQPFEALRWSQTFPTQATSLQQDAEATRITNLGDAVGMSGGFTATTRWTLGGQVLPLPGPIPSHIDGLNENGRLVGFTFATAANPPQPWTVFQGTTTFLPWNPLSTDAEISKLSVNACGTIVGTQFFADGSGDGMLWSKFGCDPADAAPPITTLTVSVGSLGGGTGSVFIAPPGISCALPAGCSAQFPQGTLVTLTAHANGPRAGNPRSVLDHWEGACAKVKGYTCNLTMNATTTTKAVFTLPGIID